MSFIFGSRQTNKDPMECVYAGIYCMCLGLLCETLAVTLYSCDTV